VSRALAPEKLVQWLKDDAVKECCLPTFLGLKQAAQRISPVVGE
jgi:hypothetical protein